MFMVYLPYYSCGGPLLRRWVLRRAGLPASVIEPARSTGIGCFSSLGRARAHLLIGSYRYHYTRCRPAGQPSNSLSATRTARFPAKPARRCKIA
nr:MAG TPA: hypothetical protein [Caudoviricetes sp.]